MNDHQISELFSSYEKKEMEKLDRLPQEEHTFSLSYEKKKKKIVRADKYFTGNYSIYRLLTKAAVILLVITSLVVANQTCAKMFGFNPWAIITTKQGKQETKTYQKKSDKEAELSIQKVKSIPDTPKKWRLTMKQDKVDDIVVTWQNGKGKKITYSQMIIEDGLKTTRDVSGKHKKVTIANHKGMVISWKGDNRLEWDDEVYTYYLSSNGLSKKKLIKMAESMYSDVKVNK